MDQLGRTDPAPALSALAAVRSRLGVQRARGVEQRGHLVGSIRYTRGGADVLSLRLPGVYPHGIARDQLVPPTLAGSANSYISP